MASIRDSTSNSSNAALFCAEVRLGAKLISSKVVGVALLSQLGGEI
jgi:hypothetical protein